MRGHCCRAQAAEVGTLKADNVKLYEKIKYLRAYGQSAMQARRAWRCQCGCQHGAARCNTVGSARPAAQVDSTEQRWKKEYDDGINPFAAFQRCSRPN